MMTVQPSTVALIAAAPNIEAILAEYADESTVDGLPRPYPRWDAYRALEGAGMLHMTSATMGPDLVGLIGVLVAQLPRFSVPFASTESFFVAKAHRKSMAGLKLLAAAEAKAAAVGAPGLLVTAPFEGKLYELLPKVGYAEVGRSFFKKVAHG